MAAKLSAPVREGKGASSGFMMPEHYEEATQPLIPMGDPFNLRNKVYDSDFHTMGKPWGFPYKHVNLTTNIRGINAIQEKFFGRIMSKIRYRHPIRAIPGEQRTFRSNVNLERPPSVPFGDFATYVADGTERIGGRAGWR